MGEVYKARDPRLGREVAIKVLPADVASDRERLRRFEQEARAASTLNHPNILTVHDVGADAGVSYLVTELLSGESLRDLMNRGPVPLDRAITIAMHASQGLAAAHRQGIVHRDLKPENLFVTNDGVCKILDFGLARMERPELASGETAERSTALETTAGTVLGTVGYMAPEQVRGGRADARSDVFSLGVVLCEMLAGANPFRRDTVVESLHAILKDDPPAIAPQGARSRIALEPIVRRCLEKDPVRRFQSAGDLAFALENLSGPGEAIDGAAPARARGIGWIAAAVVAVAVFAAVAFLVLRAQRGGTGVTQAAPIRALAVLPFQSLSRDASDDYFSDGMTDALTTELARLAALKVIARNSAARFKGSTRPPAEIARELGVAALISGSVLRAGDRVRISAQLAEADTDRVIWAESYDRAARDVLSLQGEVARAIAGAIALTLSPDEESRLKGQRAVDPRALDEYLKGRALWNRRTEEALREALAHFRAAVALAPDFALGYTGIADAHIILAAYNWMEPRQAAPIALEAAAKAMALDPTAGEPRASRGDLAFHVDHDFALAGGELDRALTLSPGYAPAYSWRSEVAMVNGRTEDAISLLRRSIELDPLAAAPRGLLGFALETTGRLEEAERTYRHALEISPGFPRPVGALVRLQLARGKTAEAIAGAQRAVDDDPSASNLTTLGVALALTGRSSEARSILTRLRELGRQRWVSPYELARVEAALGDRARALSDLRAAIEAREFRIPELKSSVDIEFRGLVDDPEFKRLIAGIGKGD